MNRNVTAVILIVIAIGIYATVTRGIMAENNVIKGVNDQYVSAIQSADELIKVRDKVREDYNNISEEDRDRLDKMIPSTVDNIRLIIDLNSIAVRHGFSLRNTRASIAQGKEAVAAPSQNNNPQSAAMVRSRPTISTPTLDTVSVSFSVTAPYAEFISFLQDLEADLRIMDVTHFTMTANDGGMYDFSVDLKTYWLRQQ